MEIHYVETGTRTVGQHVVDEFVVEGAARGFKIVVGDSAEHHLGP